MKKNVLLIIFLVLITGCSVKYNLVINNDLTITEDAVLTGNESFFNSYYKTTKVNVLKMLLNQYKDTLDNNKYKYELIEENIPYVKTSKQYASIDEYINNTLLLNDYFDEIKHTIDGNIHKIETIGYNPNNPDNPDRFDVQELSITINCPYKVISHNAKDVNENTNTYYYELNSDSDKILLEFDATKEFNPHEKAIILIIIGVVIVMASWITVYVLNKKKNN